MLNASDFFLYTFIDKRNCWILIILKSQKHLVARCYSAFCAPVYAALFVAVICAGFVCVICTAVAASFQPFSS